MTKTNIIELTKKLINIPSVSGSETEILTFIENWLKVQQFDLVIRKETFVAGKIGGRSSDRAVILAGHIDTVTGGDVSAWQTKPTEALQKGNKLYGLGASDMKAGIAGNLIVAENFVNEKLPFDLWVVATSNEEIDGQGSADFAHWYEVNAKYQEAACIISEPTDLEKIRIGQRGNRFLKLSFSGKAGHGSVQENYAESSLYAAQKFLAANEKIVSELASFKNSVLGVPSLVPTSIVAGSPISPNKTADAAEIIIDFRTVPELEAVFDEQMKELAECHHFTWEYIAAPLNSTLTDSDLLFIKLLQNITGIQELSVSVSSNDQGFFEKVGIRTVVFGPGIEDQEHQSNEFAEISKLEKFVEILKNFLMKM